MEKPDNRYGDDNIYSWSTRLSKGTHQILLDIMSEYHIPNRSATLRYVVHLFLDHYPEIAERKGINIDAKTQLALKIAEIEYQFDQRREVHKKIIDLMGKSEQTNFLLHKLQLKHGAEDLAKQYGFQWPVPELSILATNDQANRVLNKVKSVLVENKTNKTTLNEINTHIRLDAAQIKESLLLLEEHGYLALEEEQRSGRATLWIIIDTFQSVMVEP